MKKNGARQRVERYSWLSECVTFQRNIKEMICAFNIFNEIVYEKISSLFA